MNERPLHSSGNYSLLGGDLNRKKIQKRGDICVHTADSLYWTAETNGTF